MTTLDDPVFVCEPHATGQSTTNGSNRIEAENAQQQNTNRLLSGLLAPAFVPPPSPCGPDDRRAIYAKAGIPRENWPELERIIQEAPARPVGKGALDNVVGGLFSQKCLDVWPFESHTVERAYFYMLELDPTVIAYRTQVRLPNVEGRDRTDKRYVTSVTTDVLVLRENSVTLVECKSASWLEKQARKAHSQWELEDGSWTNPTLANWAATRGLRFDVFAQANVFGVELQNLEFIYAMSRETTTVRDESLLRRATNVLAEGPRTTLEICANVPGFNNRHTGLMLARGLAHGMLRSQSITLEDHFLLFEDASHAAAADELIFDRSVASLAPIDLSRPILTATTNDVAIAKRRLKKIKAMRNGKGPVSERTIRLERMMRRKVKDGLTEIEALLGNTHRCGNRRPRLDSQHPEILTEVIHKFWESGKVTDLDELHVELTQACQSKGFAPCCKSTLRVAVQASNALKRALALGGMRAYQALKGITPPDRRSLPPIAYGHTLHIDSSSLDNRSAPNLATNFPAEKARFYVGIDGATKKPMAHALIFGPARTDGLAILLREYVSRNGFLPSLILLDRGCENTSNWFKTFCWEVGISWMYSPTGGSRYNGLAENVIGRVNSQFAHKLAGSTKPDQFGRAVDGKFKSRRTARIAFTSITEEFTRFLYVDLANSPNEDNISPNAHADELRSFGEFAGRIASLDAALLVCTSISTGTTPRIERGYVRTSNGRFSSIEFQAAAQGVKQVDELRRDCVNPSVMYARLDTKWYQVFNRAVLTYLQVPDPEKLWMLLTQPITSSEARATKREEKKERYNRHKAINEAASAHVSVAPPIGEDDGRAGSQDYPADDDDWETLDGFV
ncbi:hypothetical protein [Arenimonas sp.]|uniref:hypothetical protein n=1 Tax=Arenimonas sp. TaxID=1872635 RepID=UPI0035B072C3